MSAFLIGTSEWVLRSTWQASCLAALVLVVQMLAGRRLSARARSVLWFVVIGRLLLPPLPQVRWTLLHPVAAPVAVTTQRVDPLPVVIPRPVAVAPLVESLMKPAPTEDVVPMRTAVNPALVGELRADLAAMRERENTSPPPVVSVVAKPVIARVAPAQAALQVVTVPHAPIWPRIMALLPLVWLIGAGLACSRIVVSSIRLTLKLRRLPQLQDSKSNELLVACSELMGVSIPELRQADALAGPALAGWIKPKLLVPGSVLRAFDHQDLRLMFLHELAHVRRRDVVVNWIVSAVTAPHWFNPIILFCAKRMRADCELACDELVLAATRKDHAPPRYGYTLLRLADWLAGRREGTRLARVGVVEILENSRDLQRRIIMIARFNPAMKRWPAVIAGGVVLMAGLALTDAAEPAAATRPAISPTGQTARIPRGAEASTERPVTLDDYLDANQRAQIDSLEARVKTFEKQYSAGLADFLSVQNAKIDLINAKTAAIEQKLLTVPSDELKSPSIANSLRLRDEWIHQLQEAVVLQAEAVVIHQKKFAAALTTEDHVQSAEAALSQARGQLSRALERVGQTQPGQPTAAMATAPVSPAATKSLQEKLAAAKAALAIAEKEQDVLVQHFKAGAAGVSEALLWQGRAGLLQARLKVTNDDLELREAMFGAQHPTLFRLRGQKLNEMSDYVEALQRIANLTNASYNAGAATLNEVAKADEAEAKARADMRAVETDFRRVRSVGAQKTSNVAPDKSAGQEAAGHAAASQDADIQVRQLKVAAAEAKLKVSQSNADRIHRLTENGAASKTEEEGAVAEVARARAELAEEQLRLQQPTRGLDHNSAGEGTLKASPEPQLQDAEAERLDSEASAKLSKPVKLAPLSGDSEALDGLVGELGKATGLNFVVEDKALRAAGVDPAGHLQLTFLNTPETGTQILTWALRDLGGAKVKIGYTIDHGAVLISTADELARRVVTRVYDVGDLKPQQKDEDLVSLIEEVVDPGTWRDRGGSLGSIRQFRDKLLVTQTQPNHVEVTRLLVLLRAKASAATTPDDSDAEELARLRGEGFNENNPVVLAVTGRMAARAKEKSASLKNLTVQRMQEMMVAVRLYDQERGGMPKGFHIREMAAMVKFNANENPRMPYLTYGYRWVAPYVGRLAEVKDPAHTPIFCEVAPQADGTELVAYADGHVAEVAGEAVKALETKLDRGNKEATEQVQLASGAVVTVPRAVVEQCKHIAEAYGDREIRLEDGTTLSPQEVEQIVREKIAARVQQFVQEGDQ